MDNTKVFIDIDDEITFIAERILTAPLQNVILVIPEKASIIGSLASLKLLHYVIAKTQKKVVVVTMDEMGQKLAQKAGFKTRSRVGEVEPAIWAEAPKSPIPFDDEEQVKIPIVDEPIPHTPSEPQKDKQEALPMPPEMDDALPVVQEQEESFKEEKKSEMQTPPEISLKDIKAKNPPVYALDNLEEAKAAVTDTTLKEENAPIQKSKYVESLKIVNIDGFELVVGGDIAAVKSSREMNKKEIAKKVDTISSLRDAPDTGQDSTIVGKDLEANVVKKKKKIKQLEKLHKYITATMETVKGKKYHSSKFFNKKVGIALGVILLAFLLTTFFLFLHVTITLQVASSSIHDATHAIGNINVSAIDIKGKMFPASYIEVNESSSSSLNTTGSKLVGNPATGTVLIYNLTKAALTIPKGTTIITNDQNALQYKTNDDTTIPASVSAPQSQSVAVTAADIGASYNIGANVAFVIQDSVLNASTTVSSNSTFQGGTSSTAQVVAQTDQDNLLKSLETQLYSKGANELQAKLTDDMVIVKESEKNEDVTKTFDTNVGDKATILNLSLTTKTSVLIYKKSDITAFAKKTLQAALSTNQDLHDVTESQTLKSYDSGSGNISVDIQSNGRVTPILKTHDIITIVKGKTEAHAVQYLKSFSAIKHVYFAYSPSWLGILHFLPVKDANISIQIKTI